MTTRNKRSSVLGLALAPLLVLPLADGTVNNANRQHVSFCYAALESTSTATPQTISLTGSYAPTITLTGGV